MKQKFLVVNLDSRAVLTEWHTQGAAINDADMRAERSGEHRYAVVMVLYETIQKRHEE